jgi:hypothetical protein
MNPAAVELLEVYLAWENIRLTNPNDDNKRVGFDQCITTKDYAVIDEAYSRAAFVIVMVLGRCCEASVQCDCKVSENYSLIKHTHTAIPCVIAFMTLTESFVPDT